MALGWSKCCFLNQAALSPSSATASSIDKTIAVGQTPFFWRVAQSGRPLESSAERQKGARLQGQVQGKGAEHAYKVVLVKGTDGSDVDLEVSFFPVDGKADMGGGLIWRASDDRNYYLTRANPLEQNIRIYRVEKGIRHLLQDFNQTIPVKRWHTLRVVTRG